MRVEEKMHEATNPTEEVLSDLPVADEQAIKTSGGGDVVPNETFSLNFTKIEFSYKPQKDDGT